MPGACSVFLARAVRRGEVPALRAATFHPTKPETQVGAPQLQRFPSPVPSYEQTVVSSLPLSWPLSLGPAAAHPLPQDSVSFVLPRAPLRSTSAAVFTEWLCHNGIITQGED